MGACTCLNGYDIVSASRSCGLEEEEYEEEVTSGSALGFGWLWADLATAL